jgi:hypothetical protein
MRSMRRRYAVLVAAVMLVTALRVSDAAHAVPTPPHETGDPAAAASAPSADEIMRRMQGVLWPERPNTSTVVFTVAGPTGSSTLTGVAARRSTGDRRAMLIVMLSPESIRDTAWLLQVEPSRTAQWVYQPELRRIRQIVPVEGFEAFLGTEYTYADLGLIDLHPVHRLVGEDMRDGMRAYRVESLPRDPWYYARIETWVAVDSFAPLARDYYDRTGTLWKVERFGPVQSMNGVPTVLRRELEDRQAGGRTTMETRNVQYDVQLPDDVFDPLQFPTAAQRQRWKDR